VENDDDQRVESEKKTTFSGAEAVRLLVAAWGSMAKMVKRVCQRRRT